MKKNAALIIGIISAILVIVAWLINLSWTRVDIHGQDTAGVFGDKFGAVNALFSGLAFVGLIVTILLQREDLILQRQEISDTKLELKKQNETLQLQRFENTFFNMVTLHHQIVNAIEFDWQDPHSKQINKKKGRDVFELRYNATNVGLKDLIRQYPSQKWQSVYNNFYTTHQSDLGHYFRNLYRIVKFVSNYNFQTEDSRRENLLKVDYIGILRAQLSAYELTWLFYNCQSIYGGKFKELVELYGLLKNMETDLLAYPDHFKLYTSKAYKISLADYNRHINNKIS